jgi:hypothetical protein
MPAASTIILGGIAAGGSAMNIIQGANAKGEAQQAAAKAAQSIAQMQEADRFRNLQVPTLGLEMAQQNVQARQAQQLQGLQDIGAAGVLGGLTALNTQGRAEDLALAAQAQQAQYERDLYQAQNAQNVEQRNLARQAALEQQRLLGAQGAAAAGQSQINAGIQGLAQTAGNVMAQSLANRPLFEQQAAQGLNRNGTLTGTQIQKNAYEALTPQLQQMRGQINTPVSQANTANAMNAMTPSLTSMPSNYYDNARAGYESQLQNDYLSNLRYGQGQYENFLGFSGLTGSIR